MRFTARPFSILLLASAALCVSPGRAQSQDAADLMRRALTAQTERLADIEDLTLTQEVMGMETTMYMEKKMVGGVPVLVPVTVIVAGTVNPVPQDMAQADWSNPFQEDWVDRTKLEGREELDGRTVLVFLIDDFSGLELPGMPGASGDLQEFQPRSFRYSLDEDQLLMRKVEMEGESVQADGTSSPVHMTMFLEDYREVDGYSHPFVTRVSTRGLMEAADVDRAELEAQLEEMRAQLENMPEAQRAMMERMLGSQMKQLEEMLGGEGGMEVTITVKDMKINAGPPGGLN